MGDTLSYFDAPGLDGRRRIAALAHRGFSRPGGVDNGLENSMMAFQAAVDLGFTYVETDAHGTSDGVAVALHDTTLDRTTDGHGQVGQLPWSVVKQAKIGGVDPVPALTDLLGTWPHLRVNIDVKHVSGIEPIATAIEHTASWNRVCVTSFSPARRRATVARLSRPVATSAGVAEVASFVGGARTRIDAWCRRALRDVDALQVPARHLLPSEERGPLAVTVVDRATVAAAHRAGKPVHVWTINDVDNMTRLLDLGVDGIVTDRADLLKQVLESRGQWA
ncbi:MAG: glycerophosphodiester phosphodiesterase [Cellulomonadaceae bacterium]|jgi:glycerophosphoryl diester phosphodiesterase|nr:glycerophosphodiester phosphodiesterase [Cellulomonadaceae bacterium]